MGCWMWLALFAYQRVEGLLNTYKSGAAAIGGVKARLAWQAIDALKHLI